MRDPAEFTVSLRQLRVAADILIEEYEHLHHTGQFTDPELAAAALHELDGMVTTLALAGLDKVSYDGSHINELLRRGGLKEES